MIDFLFINLKDFMLKDIKVTTVKLMDIYHYGMMDYIMVFKIIKIFMDIGIILKKMALIAQ